MRPNPMRHCFLALLLCLAQAVAQPVHAAPEAAAAPTEEGDNGGDEPSGIKSLPLPRFASLRHGEANARVGPGKQYAIRWVYHRAGLPVEIIEQFEHWRKIRDPQGDTGWVHKSMLVGKRTATVKGDLQKDGSRLMLRQPEMGSGIVLRVEPGVIGEIVSCESAWCRLQISSRKGWLPKSQIFGAYPNEIFH